MTTRADALQTEVYSSEAYLTGLFWSNPELYSFYPNDKININTFGNGVYKFFFRLGREMANRGISVFDDISAARVIHELDTADGATRFMDAYKKFDGYDTVYDIMKEVSDKQENFDSYFEEVQKYALIRNLCKMFGDIVIETDPKSKYDYHKMTATQIHSFWLNKVNKLSFVNNKIDEHFLLEGLRESLEEWDKNPNIGLEFYHSPQMTKICTGWDYGNLYIQGGFGGKGKTSITFNKVIMSCIANQEKLCVIANEQSTSEFQKMLLVTAMGVGTKEVIKRQRLNEGSFREDERAKLERAIEWVEQISDGNQKLITFVYMDDYNINDLRNIIRHYAMRGIKRFIIDTAKPGTSSGDGPRWEQFTNDFTEIYKLARPDGGGLNLAIWANVQLADGALNRRFLDYLSLGDSKKIKNECSVLFLFRPVWEDEIGGGKNELLCYNWVKDDFNEKSEWKKKWFKLEQPENGNYQLMFTSKNRRGQENENGLDVLVFLSDLNRNTWKEIGWTTVVNNHML